VVDGLEKMKIKDIPEGFDLITKLPEERQKISLILMMDGWKH
jgi:hypothetical protein